MVLSLLPALHAQGATNTAGPGEAGFRAAIAAALVGDTIVLDASVELQSTVRIDKQVTVRAGGREIDRIGIWGSFEGELLQLAGAGIALEGIVLVGSSQTDGLRVEKDAILRDCMIERFRRPVLDDSWPSPPTLRLERATVSRNAQALECTNLDAKDSIFAFNGGAGAGAYNGKFDRCRFENNFGDGLIVTYGTVKNSVFRFNSDLGLRFDPDPGVLSLSGCLFYANAGGGLLLREEAYATVDNCTFTRHTGLPAVTVTEAQNVLFRHCTVTDNVVTETESAFYLKGGAFMIGQSGRVELQNCLVADNPTNGAPHAANLIGDWIDGGGNVIGGPARLEVLHDNGGPTLSLLPLPDSPAIDAGRPSDVVVDARGLSRLAGKAPDAGAIETDATPPVDSDADGLPDSWESFHQLNPADGNDALSDTDADGQTALAEFRSRTDPTDAESVHRSYDVVLVPAPLQQPDHRVGYLSWPLFPGVRYEVEASTDLREWNTLPGAGFPSGSANGRPRLSYEIRADFPQSFFRVRAVPE
ncbi:MAG TPA: right-handed parallel beta-helix repeat-containing protein [Verrucomicrobiae bacterium]|nr:right-handed parallel beta-helix repeat-containing protein [Verrucomicrobiae bacterium]